MTQTKHRMVTAFITLLVMGLAIVNGLLGQSTGPSLAGPSPAHATGVEEPTPTPLSTLEPTATPLPELCP